MGEDNYQPTVLLAVLAAKLEGASDKEIEEVAKKAVAERRIAPRDRWAARYERSRLW